MRTGEEKILTKAEFIEKKSNILNGSGAALVLLSDIIGVSISMR